MPFDAVFAPYRLAPGVLPEEAARRAAAVGAGPLVVASGDPLPAGLLASALAEVPAGRAAGEAEACRGADGRPAGLTGPPRACLTSERHRARVAAAALAALDAGFGGLSLDRPDAPLALGLLGAGFCPDCQRELSRRLTREYGDQFQPVDYLALAREALAQAPGAVGFAQLPFGREFWRFRHDALERAVRGYARAARDAARSGGRPFELCAWFEAIGPAQLAASRHVDAAVFPLAAHGEHGIGLYRLLRAAVGRRPVAVAPPAEAPAAQVARAAALAAPFGVGLAGLEPASDGAQPLARLRALAREVAGRGASPGVAAPVLECAVLYSAEADLWSGGRHRRAVELAVEALARAQVQAGVVLRVADAPPEAALVLADAEGLSPLEAREALRRLERGGACLAFGAPSRADEGGRPLGEALPGGKPGGVRVGAGTLVELPPLAASAAGAAPDEGQLDRSLAALLGKGRRLVSASGRARLLSALWRPPTGGLDVHLATLGAERAQGVTLFLGNPVVAGTRRARFRSADGEDVSIRLNPSLASVSTILPSFSGYAVLSLEG